MITNICQSILRTHSETTFFSTGDAIPVNVDLIICNDFATTRAIELFKQMDGEEPLNKDKLLITCEHFTPPSYLTSAEIQNKIRKTAKSWGLMNFFEIGRSGIGTFVALDNRLVYPGMLVVGTDPVVGALGGIGCYAAAIGAGDIAYLWKTGKTHVMVPQNIRIGLHGEPAYEIDGIDIALTTIKQISEDITYSSFEFSGAGALSLNLDDRLELAYFISETGALNAIIPPSEKLFVELNLPVDAGFTENIEPSFTDDYELNLDEINPMIYTPDESHGIIPVEEIDDTEIDLIIIGGGMGGSLKNLRSLDKIISNQTIHPDIRLIIYPASSEIFRAAAKDGIIERFIAAGALVCSPGRGPEGYGNRGLTTKGEKVLINGFSNHQSMIGHSKSLVYLASSKTCGASALTGRIAPAKEVE